LKRFSLRAPADVIRRSRFAQNKYG